jgi:hypothetical protein
VAGVPSEERLRRSESPDGAELSGLQRSQQLMRSQRCYDPPSTGTHELEHLSPAEWRQQLRCC